MAVVRSLTEAKILDELDRGIVGMTLEPSGNLKASTRGGSVIQIGNVRGTPGSPGSPGSPGQQGTTGVNQDTGWINVSTFGSSWASFGPSWTPRFRKLNGVVYLNGLLSGTISNITLFTLPEGFRPTASELHLIGHCGNPGGNTTWGIGISPDGKVAYKFGGQQTWFSIDAVSFAAG